jgi:hypothetical protein
MQMSLEELISAWESVISEKAKFEYEMGCKEPANGKYARRLQEEVFLPASRLIVAYNPSDYPKGFLSDNYPLFTRLALKNPVREDSQQFIFDNLGQMMLHHCPTQLKTFPNP